MLGLTSYLQHNGHRSVVATDPRGALSARLKEAKLPTIPLTVRNDVDLLAGWRLRSLVRTGRYDVVHFHTARAHALSHWLYQLPSRRIVTRRMDYALRTSALTRRLYLQNVDAVVAISQGVRAALLAGGIPAERIHLIPSGVDITRLTPDPQLRARQRAVHSITGDEILVLVVGALVDRKDHHTLLQAAHSLQDSGAHFRYFICGDGPLRPSLESEVRVLGLTTSIHFLGFCPDIVPYLAAADIFVHVPLWEGLGIAVIEALAAGLPVVASRVGGIPELIDGRTTGLLVPPQDAKATADALARLAQNHSWAKALGQKGQAFVRAHYDIAVMAQTNEALYYKLLAKEEPTKNTSPN
ncbi:MAG: glycosyltransferase family 4 protein [Candidatus Binatia bacterium]